MKIIKITKQGYSSFVYTKDIIIGLHQAGFTGMLTSNITKNIKMLNATNMENKRYGMLFGLYVVDLGLMS